MDAWMTGWSGPYCALLFNYDCCVQARVDKGNLFDDGGHDVLVYLNRT